MPHALIYVAVFPISNIFSSAYVMRNSGDDMTFVAVYSVLGVPYLTLMPVVARASS